MITFLGIFFFSFAISIIHWSFTNPQYVLLRQVLMHRIQTMLSVPLSKHIHICSLGLQVARTHWMLTRLKLHLWQ